MRANSLLTLPVLALALQACTGAPDPVDRRDIGETARVAPPVEGPVALAPAIATLRQAPAQHTRLDAELQHMQTLAAQAQALQAQPRVSRDEALRALELATQRHLGATARLSAVGDQATATFPSAEATALARWLADVRINARAVPVELRLSATTPPKAGTWQGSAVFALTR